MTDPCRDDVPNINGYIYKVISSLFVHHFSQKLLISVLHTVMDAQKVNFWWTQHKVTDARDLMWGGWFFYMWMQKLVACKP